MAAAAASNPSVMFYLANFIINSGMFGSNIPSRLDPQEKEIAKIEMTWCKAKEIPDETFQDAIDLWNKSKTGSFPTLDELVNHYSTNSCFCIQRINIELRKQFLRHHLILYGQLPTCIETEMSIQYYTIHKEFPSEQELNETFERTANFAMNPEEFHEKDKKIIPVANLHLLKSEKMQEQKEYPICTICRKHIEKDHEYYELNPCGHMFHSNADNCLESCTIKDWLSKNRKCPMCRTEVVVDPKK